MDFRKPFDDNYFAISPELLALMAHLVDEYPQELHDLIKKAQQTMPAGLTKQAQTPEAHENIIDFLSLMELFAYQAKNEVEVDTHLTKQLMPAIDHIDQTSCDQETVSSCVKHASNQKAKHPSVNAQELLYKELLKRWKPSKKNLVN